MKFYMRRILFIAAVFAFGGCAIVAPEILLDWTGISAADAGNIKAGEFVSSYDVVFTGCADVLKDAGWDIDKADKTGGTIITMKKHGVTVYGSTDYAVLCRVKASDNKVQVNWLTMTYVNEFLSHTDALDSDASTKWNYLVYEKITPAVKTVEAAGNTPAAAAVSATARNTEPTPAETSIIPESELPAPPK